MENLLKCPVLHVKEDQLKTLSQEYDINDNQKVKDDILVIRDWLKKESHLVEAGEYLRDNMIRRMYFYAKGSIEGTKARIDKFCTARGLAPELCIKRTANEFEKTYSQIQYIIAPRLNPKDNCRVSIMRFLTPDLEDLNLSTLLRFIVMRFDYMQSVDYNFGIRCIVDYKNFPLSFLFKVNPMLIKKIENLCTKGYCLKVKGLHMVNVPNFFDKLLTIMKQSLSEKILGRIHVHSNYEDLHEHISKEILPEEFGGDGPSCAVWSDAWKQTLESEDGGRIIEDIENVVADETKRSSSKFNEEYLGMPGSFRALCVD